MGDVKTGTTTTESADEQVKKTLGKLLGGVQQVYDAGPKVFDESLYTAPSSTTTGAWGMAKEAAANPAFSSGIGGAIDDYAKVARGDYLGNADPLFRQALDRASNRTAADINASMGSAGRYGSDVHVDAMTDAIGGMRTNAELDNLRYEQQRQSAAAGLLPQLFGAAQLPSSVFGQIGAAEDADAAAKQQGAYDLYTRQNAAKTDQLARLSAILGGTAAAGGTTESTTVPWWQAVLGGASTLAGLSGKFR